MIYSYNSALHKFKVLHDETGGKLKDFAFQYYDCFCGESGYRIISTATRHKNPFNVVQCNACGTLRINPYLSDASIEKYYKEVYGPIKRGDMAPEKLYANQSRSASELRDDLRAYVPKDGKLLDYGSGAGGRMAAFLESGYAVYLQDYDRKYLEYGLAKGMKEFNENERYDAIILSHVLEHINQPQSFIEKLGGYLSEGGKIYIEVPMIENNNTILADLQLAHKWYFTSESLMHLAAMAGFKTVATFHNAVLITKGKSDVSMLAVAKNKSDRLMCHAFWEAQVIKLRLFLKNLF